MTDQQDIEQNTAMKGLLVPDETLHTLKGYFNEADFKHITRQVDVFNTILGRHYDSYAHNKELREIVDELLTRVLQGDLIYREEEIRR